MRIRIEVSTSASQLPWSRVLTPGPGIVYSLLGDTDPELARHLHESGCDPFGMVPIGFGPPQFPRARRNRGVYAVGGPGVVELGSPLPAVIDAWKAALRRRDMLDWGGMALRIDAVSIVDPPRFAAGRARLRTSTPVVMKSAPSREPGDRTWLLPAEPGFDGYIQNNLTRKAKTLGLPPDVQLDAITWVGPKRSFAVGNGAKPGAAIEALVSGDPHVLRAVWSWGLGQSNTQGFGWIEDVT